MFFFFKKKFLGSVEFLLIILIGSIINLIYAFILTFKRTDTICYLMFIFKNMVHIN